MMKRILIILILLFPLKLLAPTTTVLTIIQTEAIDAYLEYWVATCYVESRFNPYVINTEDPNGGSWGIAQIGKEKLDEYNEENGTNYSMEDLFSVKISKDIFMWHMTKFNDIEIAVKRWNGSGPRTLKYWDLIQSALITCGQKSFTDTKVYLYNI